MHSRQSNNLGVLSRDILGGRTGHEVKVEDTSDDVVLQDTVVNLDIHTIGVQQENSMGTGLTVLKVDGVRSVKVGVVGNSEGITVPQGSGEVGGGELEGLSVLSKSIDVGVLRSLGGKTNVLILEDESSSGLENLLSGRSTRDRESEGVLLDVEDDVGVLQSLLSSGTRDSDLGDLVALVLGVGDLDVNTLV